MSKTPLRTTFSNSRLPLSKKTEQSSPFGENTITGAVGLVHIVESQNALTRIVPALIDEMNGDAAAYPAAVPDEGVDQNQNLLKSEGGALGKQTDAVWLFAAVTPDARDVITAVVNRRGIETWNEEGILNGQHDGWATFHDAAEIRTVAVDAKSRDGAKGSRDDENTRDEDAKIHVSGFVQRLDQHNEELIFSVW